MKNPHPRILFVAAMLGRHPGWVPNPAEILAPNFQREGYECILTSNVLNRLARPFDILQTIFRRRHEYDVVSIQVYSGKSFLVEDAASFLVKALGKKIVMVMHGGNIPEFMRQFPVWTRRVLARADAIVTPSTFLQEALSLHGFQSQVIPNMLDMEKYPFCLREQVRPRLLWMRTFYEYCHPELAVEVVERLSARYEDALLTMSGQDKGLLEHTKQLVEKRGLQDKVRFPGFLNDEAKQREFGTHDIYINTNRIDNMPVAVIEARAFGLPVVAMSVGGIPHLIKDGQTGLLTPFGDAQAMADAISRLIDEPQLAKHISGHARKSAEKSAWNEVFPLWDSVYRNFNVNKEII